MAEHRVLGFHFHPIMGHFSVDDPRFYPLFEAISALGVPVMIDVGTTGMGAGMPGGTGPCSATPTRRRSTTLAADFPGLTIVAAHPGWPWVEEMTAVALHKGNVYWEMSGWAPKHFPASLKSDIRGRLQDKIMFGSDYPSLPLERLLREWDELGYSAEIMERCSTPTPSASWASRPGAAGGGAGSGRTAAQATGAAMTADRPGRPVALVTGAARGIGRAAALALAGRGYDVVINYSVSEAAAEQVAQEARACGASALVVRGRRGGRDGRAADGGHRR